MLLIILVAEIAAGAWAFTHEERLDALIEERLISTVRQEYLEGTAASKTFDILQEGVSVFFPTSFTKMILTLNSLSSSVAAPRVQTTGR